MRKVLREFEREILCAFPPVKDCISFLEVTNGSRVRFNGPKKAKRCSSTYGHKKRGWMNLAGGCLSPGTIKHEVMHSLGIFHQQSRSDRDYHVKILWENIKDNLTSQFNKYSPWFINSYGVPYDLMSVMHYPPNAFSKNGKLTIQTFDEISPYGTGRGGG